MGSCALSQDYYYSDGVVDTDKLLAKYVSEPPKGLVANFMALANTPEYKLRNQHLPDYSIPAAGKRKKNKFAEAMASKKKMGEEISGEEISSEEDDLVYVMGIHVELPDDIGEKLKQVEAEKKNAEIFMNEKLMQIEAEKKNDEIFMNEKFEDLFPF